MKLLFNTAFFLIVLILTLLSTDLYSQLSQGGVPCSFSQAIMPDTGRIFTVEPPSMDDLALEDIQSSLPYRFAVNQPVDIGIGNSGQWVTSADGTKVWRINIISPGAKALILYFDKFNIPEEGKVFVYNPRRTQLLGAFTSMNNNNLETFATGLIYGDELTLEYNVPAGKPMPDLHVSEVGYAYRGISVYPGAIAGFGGSGKCEVNVNCPEGNDWQKQKRSVTRIIVKRGGSSVWCTGSLVDNTRHDGKPYVLTADHCGRYSTVTDLSQWIFYFNYDGAGCPNPSIEPPLKSMTGAAKIAQGGNAGANGSDFFLVLLNADIPESFNVYYNGWSRETNPPSPSGTSIHHPQGDIKKISTYTTPLQPAHWIGNPFLAHWRVTWKGTPKGHGVTEGGSSGSPIFDNQGLLIGTLTGGDSSCDSASLNLPDYYGMFSYSWDQNGTDSASVLKYWLDPDNTGLMTLKGWAISVQEKPTLEWIKVFPNPVTEILNIKTLTSHGKIIQLTVSDIWGNWRYSGNWNSGTEPETQVDMTGFEAGVYLLGINDGDRRLVRKIIKL
ncbi:MAG: T9SS type A sorting domain-containing protein [Bacteroidales bacterium]|nr:T9SS type A sorting domain-containing protein [Bacteroidales bacterium]